MGHCDSGLPLDLNGSSTCDVRGEDMLDTSRYALRAADAILQGTITPVQMFGANFAPNTHQLRTHIPRSMLTVDCVEGLSTVAHSVDTAQHCNNLQNTATHYITLPTVDFVGGASTVAHSVDTAPHCNTLQNTATHYITLPTVDFTGGASTVAHHVHNHHRGHTTPHCNTPQHTATHYITLPTVDSVSGASRVDHRDHTRLHSTDLRHQNQDIFANRYAPIPHVRLQKNPRNTNIREIHGPSSPPSLRSVFFGLFFRHMHLFAYLSLWGSLLCAKKWEKKSWLLQ